MDSVVQRIEFLLICAYIATAVSSDIQQSSSYLGSRDYPTPIEIIRYANGPANNNFDDIKARLAVLEWEMKKLYQLPKLDVRQEASDESIQVIMKQYSSIDARLKMLQNTVDGRPTMTTTTTVTAMTDQEDTRTTEVILKTIECGNFKLAEKKLNQSGDTVVPKIVQKLLAKSDSYFDKILAFARALSSWSSKCKVLVALYDEVQTCGLQRPEKQLKLLKAFDYVLLQIPGEDFPSSIRESTSNASYELSEKFEESATEYLIRAMKTGNIETHPEYITFSKDLDDLRPQVSSEVVRRVVNGTYGAIETDKLLGYISSTLSTSLAVEGISELFSKIKEDGGLNNKIILKLASNLAKLKSNVDFPQIGSVKKDTFDKVVAELPICARNLFFAPTVCLWNKGRNSYLEVSDSKYNYDGERRNIFTRLEGSPNLLSASWEVVQLRGHILFKSNFYKNEILYAALIEYPEDPQMHYVFNWIPGYNFDDQSAFDIELLNDHCYIKSVHFGEYLFAPHVNYQKNNIFSHVFTKPAGAVNKDNDYVWQIRDC